MSDNARNTGTGNRAQQNPTNRQRDNAAYNESQLLGMLLTAPQQLTEANLIDPEDLSNPDYRVMLDALRDLALARNGLTEDNRPNVVEMVADRTRRSEAEIFNLVVALIEDCFSTANIADFAAKVKRASLDRRIDDAMKGGDRRAVYNLMAEQDGIKERLKQPVPKSRFVWADEFCALPPTEIWSIKDYLEPDTLCVMYGDSEAYKSFLAIDIACHIAIGKAWRGKKVKQGIALYIAGEGGNGLRKRIKAWFEYHGEPIRNIAVSTVPLALCNPAHVDELVADTKAFMATMPVKPTFISLDTLNTHFGDGDENNTADMTRFMSGLRTLRIATGATLFVPHHCGLVAKDRSRGSISLHNGIDWEYRLERSPESQTTTLTCTKVKDHEKPAPLSWNLETVSLPWADEDGQPINSAVLVPNDSVPAAVPVKDKMGNQQRRALEVLQELYRQGRRNLEESGHDPETARVTLEGWQDAMQDISEDRGNRRRIRNALLDSGHVKVENGFVYLLK
jgi:hypothetical protein